MPIIKRIPKGSPLEFEEMDNNLTELENRIEQKVAKETGKSLVSDTQLADLEAKKHTQNTDNALGQGTPYQVTNQELRTHLDNSTIHITQQERTDWNGKESAGVAQSLVNALETALKGGVSVDGDTLAKLRALITGLRTDLTVEQGKVAALQALVASDDLTLDTVQELVNYIKANKSLIDSVTANKVDKADIVDNLDQLTPGKVLDARQGKVLKDMIDALPTNVPEQLPVYATTEDISIKKEIHFAPSPGAMTVVASGSTITFTNWLYEINVRIYLGGQNGLSITVDGSPVADNEPFPVNGSTVAVVTTSDIYSYLQISVWAADVVGVKLAEAMFMPFADPTVDTYSSPAKNRLTEVTLSEDKFKAEYNNEDTSFYSTVEAGKDGFKYSQRMMGGVDGESIYTIAEFNVHNGKGMFTGSQGINYDGDYSANADPRWLTDKAYVDSVISDSLVVVGDTIAGKADVNHDHTFASLTGKPTTLAGYGITDASASSHSHIFSELTGKPTTIAGFGIGDAYTKTETNTALATKQNNTPARTIAPTITTAAQVVTIALGATDVYHSLTTNQGFTVSVTGGADKCQGLLSIRFSVAGTHSITLPASARVVGTGPATTIPVTTTAANECRDLLLTVTSFDGSTLEYVFTLGDKY